MSAPTALYGLTACIPVLLMLVTNGIALPLMSTIQVTVHVCMLNALKILPASCWYKKPRYHRTLFELSASRARGRHLGCCHCQSSGLSASTAMITKQQRNELVILLLDLPLDDALTMMQRTWTLNLLTSLATFRLKRPCKEQIVPLMHYLNLSPRVTIRLLNHICLSGPQSRSQLSCQIMLSIASSWGVRLRAGMLYVPIRKILRENKKNWYTVEHQPRQSQNSVVSEQAIFSNVLKWLDSAQLILRPLEPCLAKDVYYKRAAMAEPASSLLKRREMLKAHVCESKMDVYI